MEAMSAAATSAAMTRHGRSRRGASVSVVSVLGALALVGCDDLAGFSGDVPALTTIQLEVTGDLEAVRDPDKPITALRVALVWGAQWLPEPLCFLPPESAEVAAVVAAGCRDPLGFVPDRVSDTLAIAPNTPAELPIDQLPSADVMVGDVTARIAYASLVVFDDRDGTGRLELARSRTSVRPPDPDFERTQQDVIYGASFVSMTEPDVRIALREGGYQPTGFYPREGCGAPPAGFSVLAAGGFRFEDAIAATLAGQLPAQDPATCSEQLPEEAVVSVPLRAPAGLQELGCLGRSADSVVRYREPPEEPVDLELRTAACASIPDFGTGETEGLVQYLVTTRSDERCKGILHYVLRGCDEDPTCEVPEWDRTANPPAWWPCPVQSP